MGHSVVTNAVLLDLCIMSVKNFGVYNFARAVI